MVTFTWFHFLLDLKMSLHINSEPGEYILQLECPGNTVGCDIPREGITHPPMLKDTGRSIKDRGDLKCIFIKLILFIAVLCTGKRVLFPWLPTFES